MNAYKQVAQTKKRDDLMFILRRYRFDRDHVERMNNKDWAIAAHAAGVHHPSAEVIAMIKGEYNKMASHDLANVPPVG